MEIDDKPIIFYCKDCEEIVETHKIGGKYVYKCVKCGTKNVAFGTEKSIRGFFKIVEEKEKPTGKQKVGHAEGGQSSVEEKPNEASENEVQDEVQAESQTEGQVEVKPE